MSTPYYGELKIVSFDFAPRNWALCNGQILPIRQNQALFSLLSTQYGGDGITTFGLPNLQGASPIHRDSQYVQGQKGGEAMHTLQYNEMPTHNHGGLITVNAAADNTDPTAHSLGVTGSDVGNIYAGQPTPAQTVKMNGKAISITGGLPHNNLQPYLVLNIVIALSGIFPSRN